MSTFGPSITQSVAGTDAAERVAARDGTVRKRENGAKPAQADEVDTAALSPEALDPARRMAGADQDDRSPDRRREQRPAPPGATLPPETPHIDIQG